MPTQSSPPKLNFRQLLPILVIVLVDVMGLTIISPVLPFYALAFDASPLTIGLLISSYPLMQFFFVPILGTLSDRFGRKPVLAIAQVGTFCSLLLLGVANTLSLVFFSRIVDGITGANLATVQSAISDSTSPRDRARGLGLIGATFGLGYILGPMISGLTLRLTDNNYSAPA
nr:MFS transporter [Anaerolineae bacterium]